MSVACEGWDRVVVEWNERELDFKSKIDLPESLCRRSELALFPSLLHVRRKLPLKSRRPLLLP